MDIQLLVLIAVTLCLSVYVALRRPAQLGDAARSFRDQALRLVLTIPFTMIVATLLASLVPTEALTHLIGADSGWRGILIACAAGAVLPGGPMISFPLALMIWERGAGAPQMVGLLAAWSIYALHRVIAYELPMMGPKFLLVRSLSSFMLPPLAGGIAALLLNLLAPSP